MISFEMLPQSILLFYYDFGHIKGVVPLVICESGINLLVPSWTIVID